MFKSLMSAVDKMISNRIDQTSGDPYGIGLTYLHADLLNRENDYKKAMFYFAKASTAGDSRGTYQLGLMYLNGLGVNKDIQIGHSLIRQAADQGDANSQCFVGRGYEAQHQDKDAIEWYKKAAAQGDQFAAKRLLQL